MRPKTLIEYGLPWEWDEVRIKPFCAAILRFQHLITDYPSKAG